MTGVPLNIDWQQIMLHLLNFTILFGALWILLYKPVKDFIAKREKYYEDIDQKAQDNLKASETERDEYKARISQLDQEIRAEKEKAREDIDKVTSQRIQEARDEAEQILNDAKAEAERQKEKIITSAQKEISDMVTEATEKLALEQSASDAFDQFLDAAERTERG
ncbi:MAG: ATP synthase F0 subunit B [Clostridiales bacterium]|nr:ATP synthase F0 subunit B [Candidatus Crickella caballi]